MESKIFSHTDSGPILILNESKRQCSCRLLSYTNHQQGISIPKVVKVCLCSGLFVQWWFPRKLAGKSDAFPMAFGWARILFFLISQLVYEAPCFAANFQISMLRNQMPQKRKPAQIDQGIFKNMWIHHRFLTVSNGFLDLITSHACMKEERSYSFPLMDIKK